DVLVRGRTFVEHPFVDAGFDAVHRRLVRLEGDRLLGLAARHHPARAVRAAAEALGIAEPFDDEAAGAHRPRNDAEVALASAHRALAGNPDVFAEVMLAGGVVVVAVDRLLVGLETPDMLAQRF